MNLKFIESFVWVARLKSFRLAASKTYSTAATISSRISTLEEELGAKLFNRNSKSVALTEQGEIALSYAESMLQLKESLESAVSRNQGRHPTLRVGALDTIVSTWLKVFIANLKLENSDCAIEIITDSAENLRRKLLSSSIDLALHAQSISTQSYRSERIALYKMCQVAAYGYQPDNTLSAGTKLNIITLPEYEKNIRSNNNPTNGTLPKISKVSSACTMIAMVQGGFGIGIIPKALATSPLNKGDLVEIESPELPAMEIYLSWKEGESRIDIGSIMNNARKSIGEYSLALGDGHISLA